MDFKRQLLVCFLGYCAVAALEVLLHWAMSTPQFHWLLTIYLMRAPHGGMSLFPDLFVPTLVLAWWNGKTGRDVSAQTAGLFVVPLAAGIVGLLPTYGRFLPTSDLWWWQSDVISWTLLLGLQFFFAAVLMLIITMSFHKDEVRI